MITVENLIPLPRKFCFQLQKFGGFPVQNKFRQDFRIQRRGFDIQVEERIQQRDPERLRKSGKRDPQTIAQRHRRVANIYRLLRQPGEHGVITAPCVLRDAGIVILHKNKSVAGDNFRQFILTLLRNGAGSGVGAVRHQKNSADILFAAQGIKFSGIHPAIITFYRYQTDVRKARRTDKVGVGVFINGDLVADFEK